MAATQRIGLNALGNMRKEVDGPSKINTSAVPSGCRLLFSGRKQRCFFLKKIKIYSCIVLKKILLIPSMWDFDTPESFRKLTLSACFLHFSLKTKINYL